LAAASWKSSRPARTRGPSSPLIAIDRTDRTGRSCVSGACLRVAAMEQFDHVLNWKLKAGSHQFPGKDGGTCINEAALVVAGFAYRPIRSASDMPECFSVPICQLAMRLNDGADDEERQRLLPYVTRLACADTREVERQRGAYIARRRWTSFDDGVRVLEGALAIGRQADPFATNEVAVRLDAARNTSRAATSVAPLPVVTKVKSWFGLKNQPEPA
jgi:hypothetical protein